MKYFLFLLSFFLFIVSFAQQKSIMQPAIINSDQKLDSVNILCIDIVKQNYSLNTKTEKWIVNQYDQNKNPTELMVFYYGYSNGTENIDSVKVTLEHYSHNSDDTTFGGSLIGRYKNWIYPQSYYGIYSDFNLKSITEKIYNPNTAEWMPFYYTKGLSDLRLPDSNDIGRIWYSYDENFNITDIYKVEDISDGNKYTQEQIFYDWDTQNGFTPNYKFVFYNTYNGDNQLSEVIKKRIDDIGSGIELAVVKHNFIYSIELFEYTSQYWDEIANDWDIPTFKKSVEYDAFGMPIETTIYSWDNNQWIAYEDYYTLYFNEGFYMGYEYYIPTIVDETFTLTYNNDDLVTSEVLNSISSPPPAASGYYEGKEYYYSFDNGIGNTDQPIDQIVLYPNPTLDVLYLKTNDRVSYKIYTIEGKTLKEGSTSHQINIADFSEGVYFIEFALNDKKYCTKFIVR